MRLRMPGGVGGVAGAILPPRPDRQRARVKQSPKGVGLVSEGGLGQSVAF